VHQKTSAKAKQMSPQQRILLKPIAKTRPKQRHKIKWKNE